MKVAFVDELSKSLSESEHWQAAKTRDEVLFLFLEEIGKRNEISSRALKNMHISQLREDEKTPERWRIVNKKTNTTALENFLRRATASVEGKKLTLDYIPKEGPIFSAIATDVETRKLLDQLKGEAIALAQVAQSLLDRTGTEDWQTRDMWWVWSTWFFMAACHISPEIILK